MRRILMLTVLVVALVITPMFSVQAKVVHLGYVHSGDKLQNYLMQKAEEFTKKTGIEVEVIIGDQTKLKVMMAGGVEPDVHELPDFDYLQTQGYYVPVMPLLERDGLVRAFNPVLLDRMTAADGVLYKVPAGIASVIGFFNRTMFLEAGVATPLQLGQGYNWDSVITMGKKLTRDLNGDGMVDVYGVDRVWGYWRRAVAQAGGDFYDYNDKGQPVKSLWNTLPVEQGIGFVAQMWAEGITPWQRSAPRAEADFYFWNAGTAIDIVDSTGIIGPYLQNVTWDWDMTLLPAGPAGPIASGAGGYGPLIFASTKNLDATWEWLKFIYIDRDNLRQYMQDVGVIPAYANVQKDYAQLAGITDKNFNAIFEALNYLPPKSFGVIPAELAPRSVNVNPALLGQMPIRQFLEDLHGKMQAIIDDLLKAAP
jgi:maltose-binding protein MalE